ncbi:hypothetical protein B0A78_01655 [Flavobacterium columnare NBRC 100251 = ATCC 23463]|uniref:Uncharacterized protein n=2 Tax=Flavobacterium columnare TaxID=996 RepID=G8X7N2_FLACA|nr:hypothetical protein FCOL_04570 [Flavobacterium columnare ATCC 49512]APT22023.1 hypothetical protein BU993_04860 [Flavobacterium columnare]PDS26691.1 hypothetical protein B0A78_01655 [Flavobacterium columnare NBRC 100251 = ATCC 23463]MBF6653251.1 hypothetical protein [Flavobacterium columnare]MBF6656488.1 hypothetical protein [Flavobacterium columnare]
MLVRTKSRNIRMKNILFFIAHVLFPITFKAQCAMCRASLESTGDVAQGEAINDGIVYLMAIPYILVGLAGYYVYKMYKKKES